MAGVKGRSGRPRKPKELKVLEGSFRVDRDRGAPEVVGGFPAAPEGLSADEMKVWETFPRAPWIGETDRPNIHAAVSTYALILRNHQKQRASPEAGHPLAFKYSYDGDGNERVEPKENPLITQEIKLWGRLMSILSELGYTPASRGKVSARQTTNDKTEDKWAGVL